MKSVAKKTLLAGAAVLAMSGAAQATNIDLNLYGASAQFLFWNAAAKPFLESRGCTGVQNDGDSKNGITVGTCGADIVTIRYSSKASYDGILAASGSSNPLAVNECGGNMFQRKMKAAYGSTATTCVDVHLGASDVAGESFVQTSYGRLKGPLGAVGSEVTRSFNGVPTAGLTPYQPLVVPFGFFANKSIKVTTCAAQYADGTANPAAGNICTTDTVDADCSIVDTTTHIVTKQGVCGAPETISNITREQAVQIFGGQVYSWKDFGQSYSVDGGDDTLVACLRHAGSGTHSTLDKVIFNGSTPAAVATVENTAGPTIWFNDGSSDEMKCVNQTVGAIGYADADQSLTDYTNTTALKYNGIPARRNMIRNGAYDFFSNQWMYEKAGLDSDRHNLVVDLAAYAADPANLPESKAAYWAAKAEMVFNKADDSSYPVYVGASIPGTP